MKTRYGFPVLAVVLLLLVPCVAGAKSLEFGVKAGVNYSSMSGAYADLIDAKSQTGYVVGPFLSTALGEALGVQAEALFSAEGAKAGSGSGHVDLQYVNVPVLLRWTLLPGPAKPFVYAGPSFGFALGGKVKQPGQPDIDLKDRLRPVDTSVAAGAGVRVDLLGLGLIGDLRYTASLQDIYQSSDILNARKHVWTLSAGVLF